MKFVGASLVSLAALSTASPVHGRAAYDEWDVIVVGAGPAGIVAADRLSEAGKKTLLLEQGGPSYYITGGRARPAWLNGTDLSRVDVPGLYKSIFSTQDNLTCSSDYLNSFSGCTIGGCTAINAGLFFQPPASDFDLWFPEKWKSADVQDAIARLKATQPSASPRQFLQSGYVAARNWLVGNAGYKEVEINDEADDKTDVFGHPVFNYEGGQRSGPAKTYLQSFLKRNNTQLLTGARARQVIRDGGLANGVLVTLNNTLNTTFNLAAGGRVVLSGGALQSPQLLMLSGIGSPEALTNLTNNGVLTLPASSWINNTAVGDKLFDNPNTFIQLAGPNVTSYVYSYDDPPAGDKALYLNQRSGPYSFASETSAFWSTRTYNNTDGTTDLVGLQGTIDSSGSNSHQENNTITLNIYGTSGLLSSGYVVLDTKGNAGAAGGLYYSNPRDADAIGGYIYDIFQALPGSGLTPLNIAQNSTRDELVTWVSTYSADTVGSVLHWSSSCRFETCVDTDTKVIGTENIHVVDASILPPLSVNPAFGTMLAGERGSELILALDG